MRNPQGFWPNASLGCCWDHGLTAVLILPGVRAGSQRLMLAHMRIAPRERAMLPPVLQSDSLSRTLGYSLQKMVFPWGRPQSQGWKWGQVSVFSSLPPGLELWRVEFLLFWVSPARMVKGWGHSRCWGVTPPRLGTAPAV